MPSLVKPNMASKRRGAKTGSSKKTKTAEKSVQELRASPDSSDDEAPEEVTFEASRSDALRSLKETLHAARREREQLREKRRLRQELFQEQKKRRLLTVDVLEEINAALSEEQKQAEDTEEEVGKKKMRGTPEHCRHLEEKYTVEMVTERPLVSSQQLAAQDFIQSRLYGAGSCRSSNNQLLSIQSKRSRVKGAAVQFVKKDWASKQRAKAEKLRKKR